MDFQAYTQFHALAEQRHSCRNYLPTPVDHDTLVALFDAARLAPSACNLQPVNYLVLDTATDPGARQIIMSVYDRQWIGTAPVYIIALGRHDQAWHRQSDGKDHTDIDVAISVEHLCLAAQAMGLGSCWVCNFDAARLHQLLGLAEDTEAVAIIPLGYPAGVPASRRGRKSLAETVKWSR